MSQASAGQMESEACLATQAQADPMASEELQERKDHAALLAEKANKEAKAPLVSVVTLYVLPS